MIPSQTLSEPGSELSFDPKSAIYLPLGAASPLWFLYAGAASAGVAYWWFSRWRGATNVEALFGKPPVFAPVEAAIAAVEEVVAGLAEPVLETQVSISELIAAPPLEPEAARPEPIEVADLAGGTRALARARAGDGGRARTGGRDRTGQAQGRPRPARRQRRSRLTLAGARSPR